MGHASYANDLLRHFYSTLVSSNVMILKTTVRNRSGIKMKLLQGCRISHSWPQHLECLRALVLAQSVDKIIFISRTANMHLARRISDVDIQGQDEIMEVSNSAPYTSQLHTVTKKAAFNMRRWSSQWMVMNYAEYSSLKPLNYRTHIRVTNSNLHECVLFTTAVKAVTDEEVYWSFGLGIHQPHRPNSKGLFIYTSGVID